MSKGNSIDRREFILKMGRFSSAAVVGNGLFSFISLLPKAVKADILANVYVAKNGTPAENVAKAFDMRFGGIENFIGSDDVVVINPNGQWTNQGGSNCECCMGLIDLILNRPGGFSGEIIFTECTQSVTAGYWTATSYELTRNGPYNFNDMITYYHNAGHNNVSGVRIWRNKEDSTNWPIITGPQQGQGWVRLEWVSPTNQKFGIPYPIIRSPYSNRLIDLKNGVYHDGYSGQPALKFIKVPTLNNHGYEAQQDYAGVTSATKSFLGIAEVGGWSSTWDFHWSLHAYGDLGAEAVGQAIGAWINNVRKPDIFLTSAEWVGWGSRFGPDATQARTVALGDDPVSLDYYMCKNVMYPIYPNQPYFDPDYNIASNNTRLTLNGCQSQGIGTTDGASIAAFTYDFDNPTIFKFDIDRKLKAFKAGQATEQEILDLIESYFMGK
nr:hypothetical protein [candidate division Zixibacteria bacterium]